MSTHAGSCFCGAVKFEVSGDPNVMGYCHCTDCAHWAGAPINAFSLWAPTSVKVTSGAENVGTFAKTPGSERKFRKQCGGHVMTNHPAMGLVDEAADGRVHARHQPLHGRAACVGREGLAALERSPIGQRGREGVGLVLEAGNEDAGHGGAACAAMIGAPIIPHDAAGSTA